MSITTTKPERGEAAEYYFTYIDQVPAGDIREILHAQLADTLSFLQSISEENSLHRYAEDKWSIRQVLSHCNDTERVFVYRALWFARGFDSPLPSFDQDIAVNGASADARSWSSHIEEFHAVREDIHRRFLEGEDEVAVSVVEIQSVLVLHRRNLSDPGAVAEFLNGVVLQTQTDETVSMKRLVIRSVTDKVRHTR